jgi:hypothetical protein
MPRAEQVKPLTMSGVRSDRDWSADKNVPPELGSSVNRQSTIRRRAFVKHRIHPRPSRRDLLGVSPIE